MRLRVLPVLLFFGTALFTLRVGTMWQDATVMAGSPTEAQTTAPQPSTTPPAATAPATTATASATTVPAATVPAATTQTAAVPAATTAPSTTTPAATTAAAPATTATAPATTPPSSAGTPAAAPAPAPVAAAGPAQQNLLGQSQTAAATAPTGVDGAPPDPTADSSAQDNPFNYSDSEIELLQDLAKRRDELDKRSAAIDQREALLTATEQRMDQKLAELKAVQAQIETGLQQQKDAQDAQYKSLVKTYETMKPKDAARIFDSLEMEVLIEVTQRMKEAKLAPVLAAMDATKAQAVTVELAARRAPTVQ
ncbi:MotE family protein [Hypericibacter sp.]|uniref:MotE family protein n=1 Tax=Hypericibacter sp. TaxID=2705401 RepID=UPI003D6CCA31